MSIRVTPQSTDCVCCTAGLALAALVSSSSVSGLLTFQQLPLYVRGEFTKLPLSCPQGLPASISLLEAVTSCSFEGLCCGQGMSAGHQGTGTEHNRSKATGAPSAWNSPGYPQWIGEASRTCRCARECLHFHVVWGSPAEKSSNSFLACQLML